jgi:hypothetical protein
MCLRSKLERRPNTLPKRIKVAVSPRQANPPLSAGKVHLVGPKSLGAALLFHADAVLIGLHGKSTALVLALTAERVAVKNLCRTGAGAGAKAASGKGGAGRLAGIAHLFGRKRLA